MSPASRSGAQARQPTGDARVAEPAESSCQPLGAFTVPARPRGRGRVIDCDAKDGQTYRAPVAVTARDLWELVRLFIIQGMIAWIVPPRLWQHVAAAWARMDLMLHPQRTGKSVGHLRQVLEGCEGMPEPLVIERGFYAGRIEERFGYLRAHRPGGWEPEIYITGIEHVEAAKASGRGMLFWGSSFAFNDLIAKIALHRLGLNTFHYTRPVHGLSDTRFGIRVLNPVRTSIELGYLGARVCAEVEIRKAMEVLSREAEAGGAISIKTGNRGRHRVAAPFLGGRLVLATGPVALAQRWDVILLPIFTLRADDGNFDVIIGAPLESTETEVAARTRNIVEAYVEQLEPLVRAHPGQWRGWRFMLPPEIKA